MRYAIADIHGCFETFRSMLEDQIRLSQTDELYLLGDYVDRGPHSKALLDYLLQLQNQGYRIELLRGNHDQMLLDALNQAAPFALEQWLYNGGSKTLESYNISNIADIPQEHIQLLQATHFYKELDDFWLVHAGFNLQKQNWHEDKYAMLWDREEMWEATKLKNKPIIHGHTPTPAKQTISDLQLSKPTISIDTGCVYSQYADLGNLSCLCIDNMTLTSIPNKDAPRDKK